MEPEENDRWYAVRSLFRSDEGPDRADEDRLYTCAVVTTPAVGALTEIHDRMPLVLPPDRWTAWLDPAREDVQALVEPTPPELVEMLELRPVSTAVNNVANNGRELVERAESVSAPADQPALF